MSDTNFEEPHQLALDQHPYCFDCSGTAMEEVVQMRARPAQTSAFMLAPGQIKVALKPVNEQDPQALIKIRDSLKKDVEQYEKQQAQKKSLELQEEEKKTNDLEKQQAEDKPPEPQEEEKKKNDPEKQQAEEEEQENEGMPPLTDARVVIAGEADVHEQPSSLAVKYDMFKAGDKNTLNQSKTSLWFYCFNGNVFAPRITAGAVTVAIIFFLMYGAYTGTSAETKSTLAETVVTQVPRALVAAVKGDEWYIAPKICPNSELAVKTAKGYWHCATLKNSPKVHDEIEGQFLEEGAMWDLSKNFTHAIYRELYKWKNTKLTFRQIGAMSLTGLATVKYVPGHLLKMNKFGLTCTFCVWLAGAMYDVFDNHGPNPKCGLKVE